MPDMTTAVAPKRLAFSPLSEVEAFIEAPLSVADILMEAARRIVRENQFFSRIHVEDIATVLAASIARPDPGAIYNVADDDPAPPEDVLIEAARLLGLPAPPEVAFDKAEMTPLARSFYAESKRVRNDRIKRDLGVTLAYPDYRAGLAALLNAEG